MGMCKAIEKRLWPVDQPLKQFELKADIFYNLERFADEYTVVELAAMSAQELGELVHMNEHHGAAIRNAAKQFPTVRITYNLRPLGSDVLKIAVKVTRTFNWSSKVHGSIEPFWLWIEDDTASIILQLSHLIFRQSTEYLDVDFVIAFVCSLEAVNYFPELARSVHGVSVPLTNHHLHVVCCALDC